MNNKKIKIIIGIVFTLIILVLGGTYAWYIWNTSEEEETKIVTEVGIVRVIYDAGANMLGQSLKPVSDKGSGIKKAITIKTNKSTANKMSFNLYLDIISLNEGLKEESFRYAIYNGTTLVKEGNFSQEYLDSNLVTCEKNSTSHIVLLEGQTITTTQLTYNLYIWIDGVNYTNPNTMQDQSFNFMLHADGENAVIEEAKYDDIVSSDLVEGSLAYQIVNTYYNASKISVTNGGTRYYYDTDDSLMVDIGQNVRYYGKSPNNYIYFNCDDYSNQTADTCELWRIIGVFDNKVKIIRNTSLGSFSWDYDYNDGNGKTTSNNDWSTSSLQTLLNNQYYNSIDTTYYNNSTTGTAVNFNTDNTGLKNDVTRNMIANMTWNLGGWDSSTVYSNGMYKYERGTKVYSRRPTSWNGKIALMYPSDYGYATDFSKCSLSLNNYNNSTNSYACRSNDWLYNSLNQWSLTLTSSYSDRAWNVDSAGTVYVYYSVYNAFGVRPVLYLNSELAIESGDGTSSIPYRLSVS